MPDNRTSDVSYMQQRRDLVSTFGSKKKQAQIRARDANMIKVENVAAASAVQKLLQGRAASKSEASGNSASSSSSFELGAANKLDSGADKAMEENRRLILPPFKVDATTPQEVYKVSAMVHPAELKPLGEARDTLLAELEQQGGEAFWKAYRGPRFVQTHMRRLCQDADAAKKNPRILNLLYLRHMMRMYNLRFPIMNKTKAQIGSMLDSASDAAVAELLKSFAEKIYGGGKAGVASQDTLKFSRSEFLQRKLLLHILVLALDICDYRLNPNKLCQDLKLTPANIAKYFKELGCHVERSAKKGKGKGDQRGRGKGKGKGGTEPMLTVTLPVPVVFPRRRIKRERSSISNLA